MPDTFRLLPGAKPRGGAFARSGATGSGAAAAARGSKSACAALDTVLTNQKCKAKVIDSKVHARCWRLSLQQPPLPSPLSAFAILSAAPPASFYRGSRSSPHPEIKPGGASPGKPARPGPAGKALLPPSLPQRPRRRQVFGDARACVRGVRRLASGVRLMPLPTESPVAAKFRRFVA
jgi:hypothetical protein